MNIRLFCKILSPIAPALAIAGARCALSLQEDRTKYFWKDVSCLSSLTSKSIQPAPSSLHLTSLFPHLIVHANTPNLSLEFLALEEVKKNPYIFESLSPAMRNNEKIVLAAVQQDGLLLQYASAELRNNEKIVLAAVQKNSRALEYTSEKLRNNEKIVLAAVQKNGRALEYASKELRNNEKTVLAAVQENGLALEYASKELRNNEKIVLAAVQQNGLALEFASKELRNNEKIVLATFQENGWALQYASKELRNNEKIVLAAFQQNSRALEFASEELRNNEKFVLAAVQENGWALQYASKELRNNEKIVLAAVQQNGWALQYASKELRNNEKIVLAAVRQDGFILPYTSEELRNNKKIVLAAVQQDGLILQYASEELRNDREIALAAVHQDADAYQYVGETLRDDPEFLRIVRGSGLLPPFSITSVRDSIEDMQNTPNTTIGLFSSNQIYKDGDVEIEEVQKFLRELRKGAKEGIYFADLESMSLYGGTCSAMTLAFAQELLLKKITNLKEFQLALEQLSTKSALQGCITESCKPLRNLQTAFNAVRISPSHKQSNLDFSKLKVASLAHAYQFSIGTTSKTLEIRCPKAPSDFKKEIERLPQGTYWLRALNKADNEKLENFGHSLLFIKGKDFIGLYDPSVGMRIASPSHIESFILEVILFSLKRYDLHEARLYELKS